MKILTGTRCIAIGDSITYDTISPLEGAWRYYYTPLAESYIKSKLIWCGDNQAVGLDRGGNKMCGASGQRVDEINSLYDPGSQILRWQPNLAIIHLGTNDMTQFTSGAWPTGSVAISIANLSTLLTTICSQKSDLLVCVCKIIPNLTAGADANITLWNAALDTMLATHPYTDRIFTADPNSAYKSNPSWGTDYMSDNTHPNSAGKAVLAAAIDTAVRANITLKPRMLNVNRPIIKPYTYALRYTASTATSLGSGVSLNTAQPWAVCFAMDMTRNLGLTTSNNGILALKTDQTTPFVFLTLAGSSNRGFEFGSNANFGRFFPNVNIDKNVYQRFSKGWHKFIVTFDGVSRTAVTSYKFYLDGVPVALTSGAGLTATTNVNEIGRSISGGSAGTFDMADLQIYNGGTVMTAQQAARLSLYNQIPVGPTLIRNYKHSDGSGGTLTDATGNQNGTIGTATWVTNVPNSTRLRASTRTVSIARSPTAA